MARKGSLLIVEDDLSLCTMLELGFIDLGYKVTTARSCLQVEQLSERTDFDFALLDYHLPDGNGVRLAQWLANRFAQIKIVIMSADPPDFIESAAASRLSGLFRKPVAIQTIHRCFSMQDT